MSTRNRASRAITQVLARSGGWTSRTALNQQLQWSERRIDDELADLVAAGAVLFNPRGAQYCLAGSALARRALQRLVHRPPAHRREVLMAPTEDGAHMRVALALRAQPATADQGDEPQLVMAEFQVPHHRGDPDKAQAIATFFAKLTGALEAPVVQQEGAAA